MTILHEVALPWPHRDLHPNARGHWSKRAKAAKSARHQGKLYALECGWNRIQWPEGRLHVWIDGYAKDRRRRDHDGFLASLKPWLDGIADGMGVDDSRFVPHPWIKDEVRTGGEVRIRVTSSPENIA